MDISSINWLAVIVATLSAFVLGGMWFSPLLFGKAWQAEAGLSDDDLAGRNMGKTFGLAFLFTLIMSVNLAFFLNTPETTASWGATAGFLAGFGWIAMGLFVIGLFEGTPTKLMAINAGYMIVALTLIGLIIGAWR